jgi:transposase
MEYKNIVNYPLSQDDIEQLNRIRNGYDPHYVRNRAHSILLLFKDRRTFEDVADVFKTHVNTIRNWAERWIDGGIDGLYDLEGRGAKPIFSEAEERIILECLEKEPRSLRQLAATVAQRTGKTAGLETYRRILKKHGKSWKRMRKIVKNKPTEEEYEQGEKDIEELEQLAQDGEFDLVYFDASGFTLQPYVPYAWQDPDEKGPGYPYVAFRTDQPLRVFESDNATTRHLRTYRFRNKRCNHRYNGHVLRQPCQPCGAVVG